MTRYQPVPDPNHDLPAPGRRLIWLLPVTVFLLVWLGIPWLAPGAPLAWLSTSQAAWYLSRSSGVVGYLLLTLASVWGLLLSARLPGKQLPPPVALAAHNYLSWSAVGAVLFHAVVLLFDNYYPYSVTALLIPFTGPYSPFWVGLGIIALYLMALTSLSWRWRKQLGQTRWRRLHYLTFVAFLFATLHGLMAGTDSAQLGGMFAVSGGVVLWLTLYRVVTALTARAAAGRDAPGPRPSIDA